MTVQRLIAPGSRENAVQLTNDANTFAGIGHPRNTGDCRIWIDAWDKDGRSVAHLSLNLGEARDWFTPPAGAVAIWAACDVDASGAGELTYDTPVA